MVKRAFLVITHGDIGSAAVQSLELLMGEQKNLSALGLHPGESVASLREQIQTQLQTNQQNYDETVILVDLLGGSPSNASLATLAQYPDLKVITGFNLPLLINLLNFTDQEADTQKLLTDSLKVAQEGLQVIDKNYFKK